MRDASLRSVLLIRAVVIGGVAFGLALGSAKNTIPFTGRNASTVASDRFAASVDRIGLCANNGGNSDVFAIGPQNSLYFYWNVRGVWYGPVQVSPAGTVFSGPSNQFNPTLNSSGNMDDNVAFEGPNHTLYFVWQVGAAWYGPLQIGAPGSTYSAPSLTFDGKGNLDVTAQGPHGSLDFYWGIQGVWHGPLQIAGAGTTFSAPSGNDEQVVGCNPDPTDDETLGVAALGPDGQAIVYWDVNGTWLAPVTSGTNQEYSSPSTASNSGNHWDSLYVGPGNSLIDQHSSSTGGTNTYCIVAGVGSAFSAPANVTSGKSVSNVSGVSSRTFSVDGPSQSLYIFWQTGPASPACGGAGFYGPLQLNGAGSTYSVPAEDSPPDHVGDFVENIVVEGPAHTLWLYFYVGGAWAGPLQLGGPGTTFDSNS